MEKPCALSVDEHADPVLHIYKEKPVCCTVCGHKLRSVPDVLSDSALSFLIRSGTIQHDGNSGKEICSACLAAAQLMESACRAQELLSMNNKKRHLNGMNGSKSDHVTAQLLTPGISVNLPENIIINTSMSPDQQDKDDFDLVISNVTGSLEQLLDPTNGSAIDDDCGDNLKSTATDTDDLPGKFSFECETYDHKVVDQILNGVTLENERDIKPPPSPPSISYEMSRWLPTTCASEMSFESGFTETSHSSDCKDKELKPMNGWKCPMCVKKFDSSPELVEHVHAIHSDSNCEGGMVCPFCKKQFPTYTQLDDHITKLHGDGSHSCQGCYTVFQRPTLLRRHQQFCKEYKQNQEEQKQITLKKAEEDYKEASITSSGSTCSICLINFTTSALLGDHTEGCHTNNLSKKYNCEGCKAGFEVLRDLYAHQKDCLVFLGLKKTTADSQYIVKFCCHGCKDCIGDFAEFQSHKMSCVAVKSVIDTENIEPSAEAKPDSVIKSEGELCDGVQVKQEPMIVDELPGQTEIGDPPPAAPGQGTITCPECLIVYVNQQHLDLHTKAVHTNTANKHFKCSGCQGGFVDKEKMEQHKTRCKRIRPAVLGHPCEVCLISFEFKSLRDFHMSIHKDPDTKPYHCRGCKAGFAALTHQTSHEQKCGKLKSQEEEATKPKVVDECKEPAYVVKTEPVEDSVQVSLPFGCKLCSKHFSYFCDFEEHSKLCKTSAVVLLSKETPCDIDKIDTKSQTGSKSDSCSAKSSDKFNPICVICGYDMSSEHGMEKYIKRSARYYDQHMAGHNGQKRNYKCPGCKYSHDQRPRAMKHISLCMRMAELIPPKTLDRKLVSCPVCLIKFSSMQRCETHVNNHHITSKRHPSYNLQCEGCQAHYCITNLLLAHEKDCIILSNVRSLPKCEKARFSNCGFCNTDRPNVIEHISEHHNLISMQELYCVMCAENFKTIIDLIVHANTKCRIACYYLLDRSADVSTNGSLKTSSSETNLCPDLDAQSDTSDQASVKSGNSKWACHICGAKGGQDKHMAIHTNAENKPHRCEGCGGGFDRLAAMRSHEAACVALSNKKIFGTPIKGNAVEKKVPMLLPTNIDVTIDTGGNVALTCDLCDKPQVSELALVKHMMEDHPADEYRCSRCHKEFLYGESLTEHKLHCGMEVSHSNGPTNEQTTMNELVTKKDRKPPADDDSDEEMDEWKCLSCCVKFTDETSFLLHIASHEVSNVNRCHLCVTAFKSAADICMHMVKYHKLYLTTGTKTDEDDTVVDSDQEHEAEAEIVMRSSRQVAAATPLHSSNSHPDAANQRSPKSAPAKAKSPVRQPANKAKPKTPPAKQERKPPARREEADTVATTTFGHAIRSEFCHKLISGTQCQVCKRKFKNNTILLRHYGIHDGYYQSICLDCGTGFTKVSLLRHHKTSVHKANKSSEFVCHRCDGVFDQNFRLLKHLEICISTRKLTSTDHQCFMCLRKFDTWHQMKSHVWTHLSKCSFCDEKLPNSSKRTEHMLSCNKNPIKKLNTRTLRARSAALPPKQQLDVSDVEEKLTREPSPEPLEIINPKARFKCENCSATYATKKNLQRHMLVHEQAEYRCRICGGKFASLLAKNRHMLREHKSRNTIIKAAPRPDPEPEKSYPEPEVTTYFACEVCCKCFHSKKQKEQHVQREHSAGGAKTFGCKICNKNFPTKFARRRHMQKGNCGPTAQPISLSCHICSKRFPSNFAKLQHLKKIHQIADPQLIPSSVRKQRVCKTCNASFEHKSELRAHRRAEHPLEMGTIDLAPDMFVVGSSSQEPKVRQCKLCQAKFEHKAELRAHYRSVHPDAIRITTPGQQPAVTKPHEVLTETTTLCAEEASHTITDLMSYSVTLAEAAAESQYNAPKRIETAITDLVDMKVINGSNVFTVMHGTVEEKPNKIRSCKDCRETFNSKEELKAHRKSQHKEKKAIPPAVLTVTGETLQLLESGGKTVRKLSSGNDDIIDLTSDNDDRPPKKKFRSEAVASAADTSQAKELPFKCNYCGKGFKFRISYNQHMTKAHPWLP